MTAPVQDLATLLAGAQPRLHDGEFGFCFIPEGQPVPGSLAPVLRFAEAEGITLIVPLNQAREMGIAWRFPARMITLDVNSSLDAVGFLAAITTRLAAAGISVNVVSAFHHDHVFVPIGRAEEAMQLLSKLA